MGMELISILSKTVFLECLRCPLLAWEVLHGRKLSDDQEETPLAMELGREVHRLGRELFPEGRFVKREDNFSLANGRFQEGDTFFEVPVLVPWQNGWSLKCRIDVGRFRDGMWDFYEIKSSTRLKPEHLWDIAFQLFLLKRLGIEVRSFWLTHLNPEYIRDGALDLKELFCEVDLTESATELASKIEVRIRQIIATAEGSKPKSALGMRCFKNACIDRDDECSLKAACFEFLPERSILDLIQIRKKRAFELIKDGITKIADIPDDEFEKEGKIVTAQRIQRECELSNELHIDIPRIKDFLCKITFPIFAIDLETLRVVIPFWNYTSPSDIVPFQYSLHVLSSLNDAPAHHAFLSDGISDPRPFILQDFHAALGNAGSIIAYNTSFEISRLRSAVKTYPAYCSWLEENVIPRIVDLWTPFKKMHYYHPSQSGSTSIKAVLPALVGASYDNLEIHDGMQASDDYYRSHLLHRGDKALVRQQLLQYCEQDTLGIIQIIRQLFFLCTNSTKGIHENQRPHCTSQHT